MRPKIFSQSTVKGHRGPNSCDMDTSGHKCWTYHSGPEDFNNLLMKFCREFSILQVYHHHLDNDICIQKILSKSYAVVMIQIIVACFK